MLDSFARKTLRACEERNRSAVVSERFFRWHKEKKKKNKKKNREGFHFSYWLVSTVAVLGCLPSVSLRPWPRCPVKGACHARVCVCVPFPF